MAKDFNNSSYSSYPIGFRNNNPGNLRTGQSWQGSDGSSGGFVTFTDLSYGIRAAATVLINNISSQGNDTIRKLITKYAPPSENNTQAYINAVSASTGIDPDSTLETDKDTLTVMLHAIFEHENGQRYADLISDEDISEGLAILAPNWLMKVQNFFVENPGVAATTSGISLLIVASVITYFLIKYKVFK